MKSLVVWEQEQCSRISTGVAFNWVADQLSLRLYTQTSDVTQVCSGGREIECILYNGVSNDKVICSLQSYVPMHVSTCELYKERSFMFESLLKVIYLSGSG
jgi:hypothetical protein